MKGYFTILTLLTFTTVFAENNCVKCDLDKVKIVNEHIDSLTFKMVSDFLCTFDDSCINNVEYSEWSNETLFKVINKAPTLFFKVIEKGQVDNNLLLKEIESPINDLIDLQGTYDKLNSTTVSPDIKSKYLNAVIKAAEKSGENIIK